MTLQDAFKAYTPALIDHPELVALSDAPSWKSVVSRLEHFVDAAGPMDLADVTTAHCRLFLSLPAPALSDQYRAILATFFGWCIENGWLTVSPTKHLHIPLVEMRRDHAQDRKRRREEWRRERDAARGA